MSDSSRAISGGGIGLGGLMAAVLVVLKIFDKIDMNWFLVITSFIWIPVATTLMLTIVILIFAVIDSLFK